MKKKTIKIIAVIIACLFLIGIVAPLLAMFVFAEPAVKDETLKEYELKESKTISQMQEIEEKLNKASERVYEINVQIEKIDKETETINKELETAIQNEETQMDIYKKRVKAVCESGGMTYIELLLSAENFFDFMDKIVLSGELAAYDKNILNSMTDIKNEIEEKKHKSNELKQSHENNKKELENAMNELYKQSAEAAAYMESLKKDKERYEQYLKDKEIEEQRAKERAGIQQSNGDVNVGKITVGSLMWPTNVKTITSDFSPSRVNPVSGVVRPHTGTDIGASSGAPIWAAEDGKVILAEANGGYGNCVIIDHGDGVVTLYGHMSAILVSNGESVAKGDQIGRVGSTGNSNGPHLHFEVLIDGVAVNPMQFF